MVQKSVNWTQFLFGILLLSGCGLFIQPPSVEREVQLFSHNPPPAECSSCHGTQGAFATQIPAGIFKKMNHSYVGTADCVGCHRDGAGRTWAETTFPHSPVPNTCETCHSPQRPTGSVGTSRFDHANSGTGDCVECHANPPGNVGRVWATALYNHSPVPATCTSCHATDPTYTNIKSIVKNQMNHSYAGLPDCATCHQSMAISKNFSNQTGTANGWYLESLNGSTVLTSKGPFHANVNGTPSACNSCHTPDLPAQGHIAVNLTTTDCKSCHSASAGLTWKGANQHLSSTTACFSCHGPSNATTSGLMNLATGYQMTHSFAAMMTGTPDCFSCHGNASNFTNWAVSDRIANTTSPPVLTAKRTLHNNLVPTTCLPCHSTQVPGGTVPNKIDGFDHASQYGTECASCHLNAPSNAGLSWKKPFFNHMGNNAAAMGTCSTCHDQREHHPGVYCLNCHTGNTWPVAAPNTTKGWTGGSWGQGN